MAQLLFRPSRCLSGAPPFLHAAGSCGRGRAPGRSGARQCGARAGLPALAQPRGAGGWPPGRGISVGVCAGICRGSPAGSGSDGCGWPSGPAGAGVSAGGSGGRAGVGGHGFPGSPGCARHGHGGGSGDGGMAVSSAAWGGGDVPRRPRQRRRAGQCSGTSPRRRSPRHPWPAPDAAPWWGRKADDVPDEEHHPGWAAGAGKKTARCRRRRFRRPPLPAARGTGAGNPARAGAAG